MTEPDIRADISTEDRGERTSEMEPLLLPQASRHRESLTDLVVELGQKSAGFQRSLPGPLLESLANLVRSMNCYYSNLIEGHNTHPIDIERALRDDYSQDSAKRDLQLEARAHIAVQEWLDGGALRGRASVSTEAIKDVHRRFCEMLPEELLHVEDPITHDRVRVVPGMLRNRDVRVGSHIAISPGAVPRFMQRFETVYAGLGKTEWILATAAAHHRLLWIHPFTDGNGRVARLISHAMLSDALDTSAVWSVARGLARNVEMYKTLLANCDDARRNDLDGRGNLSEEALASFTHFFLKTCIDQVAFMESLVEPARLQTRVRLWAEEEMRLGLLPTKSGQVLDAILYRGVLPRGEVDAVVGTGERQARRIVSALMERGVLTSESARGGLRLVFPAALASRWMPGLFPDQLP